MKIRSIVRNLIASTIVAAAVFVSAADTTDAHNIGYAGYGCSGWSNPGPYPWVQVQDCYAGQQNGNYVLINHDYWGWGSPSDYQSWERLY